MYVKISSRAKIYRSEPFFSTRRLWERLHSARAFRPRPSVLHVLTFLRPLQSADKKTRVAFSPIIFLGILYIRQTTNDHDTCLSSRPPTTATASATTNAGRFVFGIKLFSFFFDSERNEDCIGFPIISEVGTLVCTGEGGLDHCRSTLIKSLRKIFLIFAYYTNFHHNGYCQRMFLVFIHLMSTVHYLFAFGEQRFELHN